MSTDYDLLDRVYAAMSDEARSIGIAPETSLFVGLMGLHLATFRDGADASKSWESVTKIDFSLDPAFALRELSDRIEQLHPKLHNVFSQILFAGVERIPKRTLNRCCSEVSHLSKSKINGQNFARWIAFRLSEHNRELFYRDRLSAPHGLARLMSTLADIEVGNSVMDPSCGVGTLLAAVLEQASETHIDIDLYGQEIAPERWALCTLCLFFFNNARWKVALGDAIEPPALGENGWTTFDRVLCDPPMGMPRSMTELDRHLTYEEFTGRTAKTYSSEMLFLLHSLKRLKPGGKAVLLVPQGLLFRSGVERRIRESLVYEKRLQAVIALPAKRIPRSTVEIALLVLGPNESGSIRMLNAAARDNPKFGRTDLPPELIEWIRTKVLSENEDLGDDARWVSINELVSADFILTPHRYVPNHSESSERLDVHAAREKLRFWEAKAHDAGSRMDEILNDLQST